MSVWLYYMNTLKMIVCFLTVIVTLNSTTLFANEPNLVKPPLASAKLVFAEEQLIPIDFSPLISTYPQPSFSILNNYTWQLVHVIDDKGQKTSIEVAPPLFMDILPNSLIFHNICRHYRFDFSNTGSGDFPNQMYDSIGLPTSCELTEVATNLSNASFDDEFDPIMSGLKTTLQYGDYHKFGFELLEHKNNSATVALNVDKGKTLVWQGRIKPAAPIFGLTVTTELLNKYQWRLVSAVDIVNGERTPISEFYYPDVPILANFRSDNQDQNVHFDSSCNGVSGKYIVTHDQTLIVGQYPSTDMGCGLKGDRIESKLEQLMYRSNSKLRLSLQKVALETEQDFPRYNLLQTMQTGETLVWQNEPLPERKYLTLESNEETPKTEINTSKAAQPPSNIDVPDE